MGFSSQLAHRAMHHKNWSMTARIPSSLPIKSLKKTIKQQHLFSMVPPFFNAQTYIYMFGHIYICIQIHITYIYIPYIPFHDLVQLLMTGQICDFVLLLKQRINDELTGLGS